MTLTTSEVVQDAKMMPCGAIYERNGTTVILTIGESGKAVLFSAADDEGAAVGKVAECTKGSTIFTLFRAVSGKADAKGEYPTPELIQQSQDRIAEWVNSAMEALDQ